MRAARHMPLVTMAVGELAGNGGGIAFAFRDIEVPSIVNPETKTKTAVQLTRVPVRRPSVWKRVLFLAKNIESLAVVNGIFCFVIGLFPRSHASAKLLQAFVNAVSNLRVARVCCDIFP